MFLEPEPYYMKFIVQRKMFERESITCFCTTLSLICVPEYITVCLLTYILISCVPAAFQTQFSPTNSALAPRKLVCLVPLANNWFN